MTVLPISPRRPDVLTSEEAIPSLKSGQADLETYLASKRFSQQVTCPRTSLVVSFSQIGDSEGCPALFVPPAVCSRWFAVPLGISLSLSSHLSAIQSGDQSDLEADARSTMSGVGYQVDFD